MNRQHNSHVLFSLSLFLLFVIGSFFIITYEIKGYQLINDNCQREDDLIVPLAYLNTKLKANDSNQAFKVVEIEQLQCLQISTLKTTTYIYLQDGYLKELYTTKDYMPKLQEGSKLFTLDNFEIKQQDQLFNFIITKDNESKSIAVYTHG